MSIANDEPADVIASATREMDVESTPEASSTTVGEVTSDERSGEELIAGKEAIVLNEELLDGPYHVQTVNAEDYTGSNRDSQDKGVADDDLSETGLHPATESGKRLGFPVEEWTEKATAQASALRNLVLDGGVVVTKVIRRLSGRKDDFMPSSGNLEIGEGKISSEVVKDVEEKDRGITVKEEAKDGQLKEKVTRWLALRREELIGGGLESRGAKNEVIAPGLAESTEVDDTDPPMKGRITVYTISGSQNCRAAKHFLRSRGLKFVEINLDAFPERRVDLEAKTGTVEVPKIFFNNVLVGGFDALNSLNSVDLDERIKDVYENEAPADSPSAPLYGEDSKDDVTREQDEFADIVGRLKGALVVKDRFLRYRLHSNCFVGSEAIDFLVEDQYCDREEAVVLARKIASKHFLHAVTEDHLFEDGNFFYRFLEHEPSVSGNKCVCLNYTGAINALEPLPAVEVANKLRVLLLAILESNLSKDAKHVDHQRLGRSEEFRRYVKLTEELHRIDLLKLTREEKLAFFMNIHNSLVIHAVVHLGYFPVGAMLRRKFFGDFQYLIGGYAYSLSAIENGLLRANQRPPYTLSKPFGSRDNRLKTIASGKMKVEGFQVALSEPEPLIHFALARGPQSGPAIQCYSAGKVDEELKMAASELLEYGGILIDFKAKTVSLDKLFKWYSVDFGKTETEVLKWILPYLDTKKSDYLSKLLEDPTGFKVTYLS